MSKFENVSVVKAVNTYFEGKVSSRTVIFADGSQKTLGLMMPGEYEFGTDAAEVMEILSGELNVLLPGQDEWRAVTGGEQFEVPANSKFGVKVESLTDYCCSYIDA